MCQRPPSRHVQSRWSIWLIILLLSVGGVAIPAASFNTATTPRDSTITVADDADAVLGLDTEKSLTTEDSEQNLVNTTNRFDASIQVTISIVQNADTLCVDTDEDGTYDVTGDPVTFALAANGDRAVIDVITTADTGSTVVYDVHGTTATATADARRSATITGSSGPPGGGGGGGGGCS